MQTPVSWMTGFYLRNLRHTAPWCVPLHLPALYVNSPRLISCPPSALLVTKPLWVLELMNYQLTERLNLPPLSLSQPLNATQWHNGRLLCTVTHHTAPVTLTFADSHSEEISFHLYQATLILGHH